MPSEVEAAWLRGSRSARTSPSSSLGDAGSMLARRPAYFRYRSRAVILAPQSANVRFSLYAPGSGQSKIRQSQWLDATFPIGIVNLPF